MSVSVSSDKVNLTNKGDKDFIAYCQPKTPSEVKFKVTAQDDYELIAPEPTLIPKKQGEVTIHNTGAGGWEVKPTKNSEDWIYEGTITVKNIELKPILIAFDNCVSKWITSDEPDSPKDPSKPVSTSNPLVYTEYDPPHWTNGIVKTKPVAFVRGEGKKPTLRATFNVDPMDIPKDKISGIKVRAKGIKATKGPNGVINEEVIFIKPTSVTLREVKKNGTLIAMEADMAMKSFDKPIADVIKHYPNGSFTLNWSMSMGGDENDEKSWYPIGETPHTVYVTLENPKTDFRQESLFYISCKAADKEDQMVNVPEKVWSGFEGLNVFRVDGKQLTYYAKYDITAGTTDSLLAKRDGDCIAWTYLFLDALMIQGVEFKKGYGNFCQIGLKNGNRGNNLVSGKDTGFMIKTWVFGKPSGKRTHPYKNTPLRISWLNQDRDDYEWSSAEVNYAEGTHGQGRNKPRALFERHFMARVKVTVNGKEKEMFYDPSYGKKFDSAMGLLSQQFLSVIAGYYKQSGSDVLFRQPDSHREIQHKVIETYPK